MQLSEAGFRSNKRLACVLCVGCLITNADVTQKYKKKQNIELKKMVKNSPCYEKEESPHLIPLAKDLGW